MEENVNSVLIIDDSDIDVFIAKQVLKRFPAIKEIGTAKSGLEALSYLEDYYTLRQRFPARILIDLAMPIMDGVEFIIRLKVDSRYSEEKTRIVIVTASLDSKNFKSKLEAIGIPQQEIVYKPLDEAKIREIL